MYDQVQGTVHLNDVVVDGDEFSFFRNLTLSCSHVHMHASLLTHVVNTLNMLIYVVILVAILVIENCA